MAYEPEPGAVATDPLLPPPRAPEPVRSPASVPQWTEAHHTVARALRVAMEVLDGRRPLAHLAGHFEAPVLRYWRAAARQRRVCSPARFTRMRLCMPRDGVAEVAVTCDIDGRPRALAARFERGDEPRTRWRCTALRLG